MLAALKRACIRTGATSRPVLSYAHPNARERTNSPAMVSGADTVICMAAKTVLVKTLPDPLHQFPVVLRRFAARQEDRGMNEIQGFLVSPKVLLDSLGQVRVAVEKALVEIDHYLDPAAFPGGTQDFGQRLVARREGFPRKINGVREV